MENLPSRILIPQKLLQSSYPTMASAAEDPPPEAETPGEATILVSEFPPPPFYYHDAANLTPPEIVSLLLCLYACFFLACFGSIHVGMRYMCVYVGMFGFM